MHAMINIALNAVYSASDALLQSADRLDRLKIINSDPANFVASIDKEIELTIVYHLQKAYPNHSIETRLGKKIEGAADEPTWLVDPLLGSFNYSRGIDCYGIAVACQVEGTITHSVLILPSRNEEFTATRGAGAHLNNRRIRVNDDKLDYPIYTFDADAEDTYLMTELIKEAGLRRAFTRISGCVAIDMAYIAAGRMTGGWSMAPATISKLAAGLILTESGALIGTEKGNPNIASSSEMIFAGPKAFKALVKTRQSIALKKDK